MKKKAAKKKVVAKKKAKAQAKKKAQPPARAATPAPDPQPHVVNKNRVRVGQVWKDNDQRSSVDRRFRVLEVDEDFYGGGRARCELVGSVRGARSFFYAQLKRFNDTRRGYSLVAEKEG